MHVMLSAYDYVGKVYWNAVMVIRDDDGTHASRHICSGTYSFREDCTDTDYLDELVNEIAYRMQNSPF
jgi:hypothetical protein